MAIRELRAEVPSAVIRKLKEGVKRELRRPDKTPSPADAPVIFRERVGVQKYPHYFVVWNKFNGLDQELRHSIIFNALKEVLGKPRVLKATAMGLTVNEAKSMGIEV